MTTVIIMGGDSSMLREAKKKALKEKIFLQSMRLFVEKGFDYVTIEEITRSCGIAKGTFYNYFPQKESILLYLGSSQMEFIQQNISKYDHLEIKERIFKLFDDLTSRYLEHPELIRVFLSEMIRSSGLMKEEQKTIDHFRSVLMKLIDEAKQSNQIVGNPSSEHVTSVLMAIYFYSLVNWSIANSDKKALKSMIRNQLEIIWKGVHS
ncbi:TetR/AcrR family transcriptional regulator [Thermoactinomyces sp. DSM 45891]|uniref:TetR/AcrR family transcriptional regulator n=1 Tax=Thermoactinomyces sp. DSM 45891 TaxID=1761907 RepID=UPI0009F5655F|nr:TetR/AcrR family transcriptional regulator [Thermoactinomyces sp. DSM 45891]